MIKRILSVVMIFCMSIFYVNSAQSLSCAPPQMNESVIQEAEIVVEGWVSKMRDLSRQEKGRMQKAKIVSKGGDLTDFKAYELRVTKAYKGAANGDQMTIYRNTYWGDTFSDDEPYFILLPKKKAGFSIAPLCGHSMHLRYAKEQGVIAILQEILGE